MKRRILFVGMGGVRTTESFASLHRAGAEIVGVVQPLPRADGCTDWRRFGGRWLGRRSYDGEWLGQRDMTRVLTRIGVDVFQAYDVNDPSLLRRLARLNPHLICVSSSPQLFGPELLALPRRGCINLHPSLLPRFRGPQPLFWMFREGAAEAGVTVHYLDQGVDTGDVLHQESLRLEDGVRGDEIAAELARRGAALLTRGAEEVLTGKAAPRKQPESGGSRQGRPGPRDLQLSPKMRARQLFNFVRGVSAWYELRWETEEVTFWIADALGFDERLRIPGDYLEQGDELLLNCADGSVRLKLSQPSK